MAKIIGLERAVKDIGKQVVKTVRSNKIEKEIKKYLADLIKTHIDARGQRFPDKKESTKKAYRRKGYNTKDWLVRTGESTKIKKSNIKDGVMFEPSDPDNILQYVKQSEDWLLLNEDERAKIINIILGDLYEKHLLAT